jgi:hypothetical protein
VKKNIAIIPSYVGTFFSFHHHHQENIPNIATYTSPQMHASKSITYTDANSLPTLLFQLLNGSYLSHIREKNSLLQEPSGTVTTLLDGYWGPNLQWQHG